MTAFAASRTSVCASLALVSALLAGCGGTGASPSTPTQPSVKVRGITVTPSTISPMTVGDTLQLAVTETLSDGQTLTSGFDVQWTSSDDKSATVSGSGLVTAWRSGAVTITATSGASKAIVTVRIQTGARRMSGVVTQPPPKGQPVAGARVTVVEGRYEGISSSTDSLGRFVLYDVTGVVKLRVSAPYFQDLEVTLDAGAPVVVQLAPLPGMIIDAIAGSGGGTQRELRFDQRRTGPAHLTVFSYLSDDYGVEAFCGELRDDENRLLWQTSSKESRGDEATSTLTLTGGKSYTLKVYDCTPPQFRTALGPYRLKAEHM
jgi:Bacterial Ig-like domain (group 2)/Carboxypeptidase regulatory-like domain